MNWGGTKRVFSSLFSFVEPKPCLTPSTSAVSGSHTIHDTVIASTISYARSFCTYWCSLFAMRTHWPWWKTVKKSKVVNTHPIIILLRNDEDLSQSIISGFSSLRLSSMKSWFYELKQTHNCQKELILVDASRNCLGDQRRLLRRSAQVISDPSFPIFFSLFLTGRRWREKTTTRWRRVDSYTSVTSGQKYWQTKNDRN